MGNIPIKSKKQEELKEEHRKTIKNLASQEIMDTVKQAESITSKPNSPRRLRSNELDAESVIVIDRIVSKYLKNDHINNPLVPDFLEKHIYSNILRLVLGILQETSETTSLQILGHEIKFTITPISN